MTTGIETDYWGHVWENEIGLPSSVPASATPWSSSAQPSVCRHAYAHLLAFLDGFDLRDAAAKNLKYGDWEDSDESDSGSESESESESEGDVFRRFLYFDEFAGRKLCMRDLECGEHDESAVWGSSAMESFAATRGMPTCSPFGWTQDPTSLVFSASVGSGWMPMFPSLSNSEDFTPGRQWNPWARGGISADMWGYVSLKEHLQETGSSFSKYIFEARKGNVSYRAWIGDVTFDDVVENEFGTQNACFTGDSTWMTTNRRRMSNMTFAPAYQALSMFDRTYYVPCELTAFDEETSGACVTSYRAKCKKTVYCDYDGNVTVSDPSTTELEDFEKTGDSMTEVTEECEDFATPQVEVSAAGRMVLEANGHVSFGVSFDPNEYEGCLAAAAAADEMGLNYISLRRTSTWGSIRVQPFAHDIEKENFWMSGVHEGEHEITATLIAVYSYSFRKRLNSEVSVPSEQFWKYPNMPEFLKDGKKVTFNFFQSFASSRVSNAWTSGVDFSNPVHWNRCNGFGYRFERSEGNGPGDYPDAVDGALAALVSKCREMAGSSFDSGTPSAYMGLDDSSVQCEMGGSGWSGWSQYKGTNDDDTEWDPDYEGNRVYFTSDGEGGYRFSDTDVTAGTFEIWIGNGTWPECVTLPDAITVTTHMKALTQADWDFPQLKRVQD